MKNRRTAVKNKMAIFLSVLLAVTMLLSGALLTLASNNDGAVPTTSFTQHYETDRPDGEYYVTKVIVERVKVYTVRFFLGEDSDKVFVGSVKVKPGDCIPPYESIEGVATVTKLVVKPDEEFHGWYYYDTDGKRVDVPEPADVFVYSDMDLFAYIEPRLPRAIEFVFYGHVGENISVSVNGSTLSRQKPDFLVTPTPVFIPNYNDNSNKAILDGVRNIRITWMFVEERYNAWQSYDLRLGYPYVDWPKESVQVGLKPFFFHEDPRLKWIVCKDSIESNYIGSIGSNEYFVGEMGYNDFMYGPSATLDKNSTLPSNTYYMEYAIANSMEFVKKTVNYSSGDSVEYLIATFHVYPTYIPVDNTTPNPGEGGVQGEDEE